MTYNYYIITIHCSFYFSGWSWRALTVLFALFLFIVVEAKDGAISVASAFAGFQEGILSLHAFFTRENVKSNDLQVCGMVDRYSC